MFDADFVDKISELVQDSVQPRIIDLPKEPPGVYGVWLPGFTEVKRHRAEPAPRSYKLLRLDQVAPAVQRWGGTEKSVVFVSADEVTVVFDEAGDRRERAVMPLSFSDQYRTLRMLAEKQHQPAAWLDQRELLSLLRNQLGMAGTVFANQVKRIKVVGSEIRTATVDRGRESLGAEAEASISGDDQELPDQIEVRMPIFDHVVGIAGEEFFFRATVNVEFNAAAAKFKLVPGPGEIRRGLDMALSWIVDVIQVSRPCSVSIGSADPK